MYVIEDRKTPAINGFFQRLSVKNKFLASFPRTTYSGPDNTYEVFDKLVFYKRKHGVYQTDTHKKIYKLLGIEVSDLEAESYDGVEECYIYLKPYSDKVSLAADTVVDYIHQTTDKEDSSWITGTVVYRIPSTKAVSINEGSTPQEIRDYVRNKVATADKTIHFSATDNPQTLPLVLLDSEDTLFESEYKVNTIKVLPTDGKYEKVTYINFVYSISVTIKYRRLVDCTETNSVLLQALDIIANQKVPYGMSTSILNGLNQLYYTLVPLTAGGVNIPTEERNTEDIFNGGGTFQGARDFKPSYLNILTEPVDSMTGTDFGKLLEATIDTGFTKQKASFFEKLLAVVLVVVIVIATISTGGAATVGLSGFAAASAFAGAASITLGLSMLGLSLLTSLAVKTGHYGAVYALGGAMKVLGLISTVLAVVSMYGALKDTFMKYAVKEVGGKTVEKSFLETLGDMIGGEIKKATSNMLQTGLKWVTNAFNVYSEYINPPNKGLDEKAEELKAQEAEMADYSSADMIDNVNRVQDSPYANPYDFNEHMQTVPYLMTQGLIDKATTKYYN